MALTGHGSRRSHASVDPHLPSAHATAALILTWTLQAARYQMIVMFLVCSNSGLCSVATVYGAAATVIDGEHRLRLERLRAKQPRDARMAGAVQWVWAAVSVPTPAVSGVFQHGQPRSEPGTLDKGLAGLSVAVWQDEVICFACLVNHIAENSNLAHRSQRISEESSAKGQRMMRCQSKMWTNQTWKQACR